MGDLKYQRVKGQASGSGLFGTTVDLLACGVYIHPIWSTGPPPDRVFQVRQGITSSPAQYNGIRPVQRRDSHHADAYEQGKMFRASFQWPSEACIACAPR